MLLLATSPPSLACGGFFCQTLPIDQAAEQIVFRQSGEDITAMVRILYEGEAENFSWVVPVPDTLDIDTIALGADATFDELELATRPRFVLERRGGECPTDDGNTGGDLGADAGAEASDSDGGVDIVEELSVGPFDIQVVASEDPEAMAQWLIDNDYDLNERGRELIAPYVAEGMWFVALKLRSGETSGSIQPLVMNYRSAAPMIPLRLTAIAALEDMGVLTWIVGESRAVPENYLHVTPNYARLNWYLGPQNAYASYQNLITAAMNEVEPIGGTENGQGFATDFAGPITSDIDDGLSPSRFREGELRAELERLDTTSEDAAEFIARALAFAPFDARARFAVVRSALPLPEGADSELHTDAQRLRENYTADALDIARVTLREAIVRREIEPLVATLALLPEGAYMTRLFTTLSADEMSIDPTFTYNAEMPDQPLTREALLDVRCGDEGTEWTLTLGAGTGRDGELVINARQPVPFQAPSATDDQEAAFVQARTSADAEPLVLRQAAVTRLDIAADGSVSDGPLGVSNGDDDDDGFLGPVGPVTLVLFGLLAAGRRRPSRRGAVRR